DRGSSMSGAGQGGASPTATLGAASVMPAPGPVPQVVGDRRPRRQRPDQRRRGPTLSITLGSGTSIPDGQANVSTTQAVQQDPGPCLRGIGLGVAGPMAHSIIRGQRTNSHRRGPRRLQRQPGHSHHPNDATPLVRTVGGNASATDAAGAKGQLHTN